MSCWNCLWLLTTVTHGVLLGQVAKMGGTILVWVLLGWHIPEDGAGVWGCHNIQFYPIFFLLLAMLTSGRGHLEIWGGMSFVYWGCPAFSLLFAWFQGGNQGPGSFPGDSWKLDLGKWADLKSLGSETLDTDTNYCPALNGSSTSSEGGGLKFRNSPGFTPAPGIPRGWWV